MSALEELSLPGDPGLSLGVPGLPRLALLPDLSYLAPDCFHPSQKLHATSEPKKIAVTTFSKTYR